MNGKQKYKKIYIKKSNIHDKGIFASQYIKKGEIITFIKGEFVNFVVKNKKDAQHGPDWFGICHNTWINPVETFCYLNHSCDPNAGIKGKVEMVALKNIKREEEITIDYSITEEDTFWALHKQCNCGSKKCRKIIKSIQFLPQKVFDSYLPYIPKYFQKVYIKHHNNEDNGK